MSSSSTGTMRGSISTTVTSVPKRLKIDANSTPTAPAPITIRLFGTAVRFRISILVRMNSASGCKPGQHARFRAGGENDVLRFQRLHAGVRFHFDFAAALQRGEARDPLHLGPLQQEVDALGMLVDDSILAVLHLGIIEARDSRTGCPLYPNARTAPRRRRFAAAIWWGCSPPEGRFRPAWPVFQSSAVLSPYWPARMAAE